MLKSLLNPALRRIFSDAESYFKYSLNNLFDNFYNSSLDESTDGEFDAVVISGFRTNTNNGSGHDPLDGKLVSIRGSRYSVITVVPLSPFGDILANLPEAKTLEDLQNRLRLYGSMFQARSEFTVDKQPITLEFGQKIKCYFESGKISTSNFQEF